MAAKDILKITKQISGLFRILLLYRLIQIAALPLLLLHVASRLLKRNGYRQRLAERFGFLPPQFNQTQSGCIWLHAVSVGEVSTSLPLLRHFRQHAPDIPLYLSTSTLAGRQIADKQAQGLVNGIFFLPFDLGPCMRRAFRTIRPRLLVVMETELWPNLFATAYASGTPLAILNGRISDRTWPTYQRWRWFFRKLLQIPDLVQVQSQTDLQRYRHMGVPEQRLVVDANLKYDAVNSALPLSFPTFGAEQVWIAASTVGPDEAGSLKKHSVDEDDLVLSAFLQLAKTNPKLLLIIAPRQPARFDKVAAKLDTLALQYARRSNEPKQLRLPGVLLLDTLGELARVYGTADVVFVGGSLAPRGGHNILEPAAAAVPIIVGPNMQNFEAITREFLDGKALVQIASGEELAPAVCELLRNREKARNVGAKARDLVQEKQGVALRSMHRLLHLYRLGTYRNSHGTVPEMILGSLSRLWLMGAQLKRMRDEQFAAKQQALPVPVISVGGLSVGGSGKTPLVVMLAKLLQQRGYTPGILTRGYRRRSKKLIVAAAGELIPASETGDEAQILLHSKTAAVGIGAERWQTARLLLERFPQTDLLLLDDGFQHARMPRTKDIVAIDSTLR